MTKRTITSGTITNQNKTKVKLPLTFTQKNTSIKNFICTALTVQKNVMKGNWSSIKLKYANNNII